jgi:hypothetical protein
MAAFERAKEPGLHKGHFQLFYAFGLSLALHSAGKAASKSVLTTASVKSYYFGALWVWALNH